MQVNRAERLSYKDLRPLRALGCRCRLLRCRDITTGLTGRVLRSRPLTWLMLRLRHNPWRRHSPAALGGACNDARPRSLVAAKAGCHCHRRQSDHVLRLMFMHATVGGWRTRERTKKGLRWTRTQVSRTGAALANTDDMIMTPLEDVASFY